MTTEPLDEALIPLAFSLHGNRGGYAVLAGAGVSMGAGVPSAWAIITSLAEQLRQIVDADSAPLGEDTVTTWWQSQYTEKFSYSGLFDKLSNTKLDREALLRRYIEVGAGPGAAHRAVARLVQLGVIEVIVTINFDHLFEDALRERGVHFRTISTEDEAKTGRPLHGGGPVIVHLHGEYTNGSSMLNTPSELDKYGPAMEALVAEIFRNHGLLIAGWSAESDHALRDLVTGHHRGYFRPVWITPNEPTGRAINVIKSLGAQHIAATADAAFAQLADAAITLDRQAVTRHPATPTVVVDRIKRDLAGDRPAMTAHDTVHAELSRLTETPALAGAGRSYGTLDHEYPDHLTQVLAACIVPSAAVAAATYWGDPASDAWWLPTLEQWCFAPTVTMLTPYVRLRLTIATSLYFAAGVAATAMRRYDTIATLFASPVLTNKYRPEAEPACRELDWDVSILGGGHSGDIMRRNRPEFERALGDAVGLGADRVSRAWQEWEVLRLLADIYTSPGFSHELLSDYRDRKNAVEVLDPEERSEAAQKIRNDLDRVQGKIARLSPLERSKHIEVLQRGHGTETRWRSQIAERLLTDPGLIRVLNQVTSPVSDRADEARAAVIDCIPHHIDLAANAGAHPMHADVGWLDARP